MKVLMKKTNLLWTVKSAVTVILLSKLQASVITDGRTKQIFASTKNCQCKSKIIEISSAIPWNKLAIKISNVNLGSDGKIGSNSTFVLKLVSRSFQIQKCNLRLTSFPVAYFELWEKWVSFFPNNMKITVTYWFQYEWRA